jgi:hypothetical protein
MARLARAQLEPQVGESTGPARDLGLSRDAASLAWTARALHRAGKKAAAIRVYREALNIACRPDLSPASDPVFSDDTTVRRYLLPGEAVAATILRELIADGSWTFQEWSEAVTGSAVAPLAAARIFRAKGKPEAQPLLEQIVEEANKSGGLETDPERAIRHAAAAEAHALLAQWKEAEQQYRHAIEQIDELTIKRSWWFNLASIATHLDDETQRKAALEAALEAPVSDEISRRALAEFEHASEPIGRLRLSGAKAN